jgi:uridine kinase
VVIIEGLFALYWPELRQLLDTKIYVEADDAVCLERRLLRDVRERGRTRESVEHQFRTTVVPMTELYVRPTRDYADIVALGDAPVDETVTRVLNHMKRRLTEVRNS